MAYPRISSLDFTALRDRLKEAIPKRPDGTPITVWDQLPEYGRSVRALRDAAASTDVFAHDIKDDLDSFKSADNARHAALRAELDELKEVVSGGGPFPA